MANQTVLSEGEIAASAAKGWDLVDGALQKKLTLASVPAAVAHVVQAMFHAEQVDHHPDVALTWRHVTYRLSTHSAGGITQLDLDLAERIDGIGPT